MLTINNESTVECNHIVKIISLLLKTTIIIWYSN